MSWEEKAVNIYDTAIRFYDRGEYSVSLLIAYTAIQGFMRRVPREELERILKELGELVL